MSPVELERKLMRWGRIYGERPDVELPESARAPAVHPIARSMEFAPGTNDKRQMISYHRSLRDGEKAWSRDPIRCTETRTGSSKPPIYVSNDDDAEVIQREWLIMTKVHHVAAEALRLQYQVRDEQRAKAKRMGMARNKFREVVAEARGWILARINSR